MFRAITAAAMMLFGSIAAMATEPATETRQIQDWIEGLDDSSFAAREDATMKLLVDHSTEVLEAVVRAAESTRLESGWRAGQILRTWLRSGDAELEKSVRAVTARWSATKDERLVRLAGTVTAKPRPSVQTKGGPFIVRIPVLAS